MTTRTLRNLGAGLAFAIGALGCQSAPVEFASDETIRQRAQLASIAELETERAAPSRIAALVEGEAAETVRERAALAISRSEHVEMLPPLLALVADPTARVRRVAAFGLGQLDLALDDQIGAHRALREQAEMALARALETEEDPAVREALIRALGRVSMGQGLTFLVNLASVRPAERAPALTALGVAATRGRLRSASDTLARVAERALHGVDPLEQRAGAYVVFRQKVPFTPEVAARLTDPGFKDSEARIHLLRAVPADPVDGVDIKRVIASALDDPDWRVRVEGIRAASRLSHPFADALDALIDAGQRSVDALVAGEAGGHGHVVSETCNALVNSPRDRTAPLLERWQRALKDVAPFSGCRCAVARDAQQGRIEAVERCAPASWGPDWKHRLAVAVAGRTELPVAQKIAWLATAMRDPRMLVRLDTAMVLESIGQPAAALAFEHLSTETHPAVAATLVRTAAAGVDLRALEPRLAAVVDRFITAGTFEEAEPLIEAGHVLRRASSETGVAARDRLLVHPVAQVRRAAEDVPFGERIHEPMARTTPVPAASELPRGARLLTSAGTIEIAFEREVAPLAVQSFVELATRGFFAQTVFHRVIPDFVAQGGDPEGTGSGGPGYTIPCENHDGTYSRGSVGVALAGKDTGGSQFFLTHSAQPHLDGRYTRFAQVVQGIEVMDALTPVSVIDRVELID